MQKVSSVLMVVIASASMFAQSSTASAPAMPAPSLVGLPANIIEPDSPALVVPKIVDASYPLSAPDPNLDGQVISLKLTISEAGDVENVKGVKGEKVLYDCAVAAIKQWHFDPLTKHGKPVKASAVIQMRFVAFDHLSGEQGQLKGTPEAESNRIAHLSGNAAMASLVGIVLPAYPRGAIEARLQGQVRLAVVIGKDGTIREIKSVSGHPLLTHDAVEVVRQWRYRPYTVNGEPTEVETAIALSFIHNGMW